MALSINEAILTANRGWVTTASLRPADQVFHPAGHVLAVTFVSKVEPGSDCFRVVTTGGRSVVVDGSNPWLVVDKRAEKSRGPLKGRVRWFEQQVATTSEMYDKGLSRYSTGGRTTCWGGKTYSVNENRFVLPTQQALQSPEIDLPVDPYLLGAWLGDGTSSSAALTSHRDDVPHWVDAITAAGFVPTPRPCNGKPNTWTVGITSPGLGRQSRSGNAVLRRIGVLGNKHVPDLYLAAGTAQREALLQGLLDTDGCCDAARGQVEFCSTNFQLAEAALFLARSLGWRATLRAGRAKLYGKDCGPKYRVFFTPKRSDPHVPFRLSRKVDRVRAVDGGAGRATLSIASIEPVATMPVRHILVESPAGADTFLAGRDMVPTASEGGGYVPKNIQLGLFA